MRVHGLLAQPALPLLLCFASSFAPTFASPPIHVALDASFPSPPWIVELLEAAAIETESSYIPLLEAVAAGRFDGNDEQAYQKFLDTLRQDGHIADPAAVASLKLSLALREAAPRIQAHHQFWDSSVSQFYDHIPIFSAWKPGLIRCFDPHCSQSKQFGIASPFEHTSRHLQFDRIHRGNRSDPLWTLYIDLENSESRSSYREWRAANPTASFRVRYQSPINPIQRAATPLRVSGYGVELALKKTDYIVIDDREAEAKEDTGAKEGVPVDFDAHEQADLKPLSSSELFDLGVKASSFIMQSDDPLETLARLTQDFPKHASALAQRNISQSFLDEHEANRDQLLPPGYNVLWVNGVQISPRQVDAFSLLDHFRRERKLIGGLQKLGFAPPEAIALLTDNAIAESQTVGGQQRYDWRDESDGGNVIMWLNNLEKDKRYAEWPTQVNSLLRRTFPGQMPSLRKDLQNIVFPVDLTQQSDVEMIVEVLQNLVQRMVAARFGIVPTVFSTGASEQARVAHYLQEAYGLGAVMHYLELSLQLGQLSTPSESAFETARADRTLRGGQSALPLAEVKSSSFRQQRLDKTAHYLERLGADKPTPPFFANGVPVSNDEDWMQAMSHRLSLDMRTMQEQIAESTVNDDTWLPGVFLKSSILRRNTLIVPADENEVQLFDVGKIYNDHWLELKDLQPEVDRGPNVTSVTVILDMNSKDGLDLLLNAIEFSHGRTDVDIAFKHQCRSNQEPGLADQTFMDAQATLSDDRPDLSPEVKDFIISVLGNLLSKRAALDPSKTLQTSPFLETLGLKSGEQAILVNGRLVGPIPNSSRFMAHDFDALVTYELRKRISPTLNALANLNLTSRVKDMQHLAKLSSMVALSTVSDVPEGIFDNAAGPRMNRYNVWSSSHTCIERGKADSSTIEIVASLDPISEVAQRWTPILRLLSQFDGVRTRIFLNPQQRLQELPVKRFYRQVLNPEPSFRHGLLDREGARAEFVGIPNEALLTMGLETPPSWLVAPKESEDDLDNIKLNSIKRPSSGVNALYELEHILIEGHSRDVTAGSPPRGAQLVLGTQLEPHFAKTIIMANLGYFQFKANPGVYDLGLEEGRSKQIFKIDSAGTRGYNAQPGDDTTDILLMSFQGATVFPRVSRNPGKEDDDVLEPGEQSFDKVVLGSTQNAMSAASQKLMDMVSKGSQLADGLLAKAGLSQVKTSELLNRGFQFGQGVLDDFDLSSKGRSLPVRPARKHAEINIFSVASGHLYERMLNIMILSVMKHTNHTVKFWFIEQFLSPSFKTFLPTMAAEYNFDYEMVTYRWPHWLRAQKEKQRIIWGYKILFLDVLFPLDLDKVIFVDADQIVRTDMYELVTHDLEGAPYGFTPMCDSRTEMEGFRFWKQGYWKSFLRGLPYHISALYVVDLKQFRTMAAGDRLRQQYHTLSADPNSLSNLDQDLPNHMQMSMPIHSLPQDWLWCETWCDDESLKTAKTIDLCNNPMTKEPKLDRARRQVPEWTVYDEEIAALAKRERATAGGTPEAVVADSRLAESHGATAVRDEL